VGNTTKTIEGKGWGDFFSLEEKVEGENFSTDS